MEFFPRISNTCAECGQPTGGVYALNRDVARAGGGVCAVCAGVAVAEEDNGTNEAAPDEVEVDATDAARALAAEAGVSLADVAEGLEPGQRVGKPDVTAFLKK